MDITPLHPGASNATTGAARRRDDGDRGFRGVMELVAHFSAATPHDDIHRPAAGSRERPAESKVRDGEPTSDDQERTDDDGDETVVETSDAATPRTRRASKGLEQAAEQAAAGLAVTVPVHPAPDRPAAVAAAGTVAPVASADTDTSDLPPVPTAAPTPTPAGAPALTGRPLETTAPTPAAAPTISASATPVPATPMPATTTAPPLAAAPPAATGTPAVPTDPAIAPAADRNPMPPTTSAIPTQAASASPSVPDPTGTSSDPVAKDNGKDGPGIAKVTVEATPAVVRSQGVASAVLVQAHMAAAGDAGGHGAGGQSAGATPGTALHVGGSQPLFVGADGGNARSGGQGGQQNGGQQNGGQAQAGGFAFGAATIGQRGFGGDAARAQFQEILATRTARAPLQGSSGSGAPTAGAAGSLSSTHFTAGPGGPQSTLPTAMASRAEATAQGRPGANPGTVVGQVAVKLASTAADGGGRVTIRLNPEELGKVDVKLELGRDGLVRATISAEKPETLDLLQRDARGLEKALQEAGLKTDQGSLSFDLRGGNGQPSGHDGRAPALAGAPPTDEQPVATDTDTALVGEPGGVRADGSYDLVA